MQEYERSQKISAQAHEVFAWLSHVGNLPSICPRDRRLHRRTVCRGVPGRRIRTTLQYPGKEEGTFDAEGYLDVDEGARRMEWGAEGSRDYSGWLAVAVGCDGASEITVHPSFGWRSVEPEMREQPPRGPRRPPGGGHSRRRSSLSAGI